MSYLLTLICFSYLCIIPDPGHGKRLGMILDEAASIRKLNDMNEFGKLTGRRSKVDMLGNILKRRVSALRSQQGADLVFLVDSSASVGSQNFYNEIKFIRKVRAVINKLSVHAKV